MPNFIIPAPSPLDAIIDRQTNLQPNTKYRYKKALHRMIANKVSPQNVDALIAYADSLTTSNKGFLKAALNTIYHELKLRMKAKATKDNALETMAAMWNMEALNEFIQVRQVKGTRAHTWLSSEQVSKMTALCNRNTMEGRRDWIVLSLMLGAGLRRDEVCNATFDWIKTQPSRNQERRVLQITGKGAKNRVVPINVLLARRLEDWGTEIRGGQIARGFKGKDKERRLSNKLSGQGVNLIVQKYGCLIGVPEIRPHDLRRSYAMIGYQNGIPITQISVLLGHESIQTTQRYLNLKVDLKNTVSDAIPLAK